MNRSELLSQGRASFQRQAWGDAYASLAAADRSDPLDPEDLFSLAMAAHLIGRDTEGLDLLARAHQGFLNGGRVPGAARCAFWLAFANLHRGELAQSSGWLARARRMLEEGGHDCVEGGYLLVPEAIQQFRGGDLAEAYQAFLKVGACGERFGDRNLTTLALNGQGRTLIRQGETERGVALLDEAMVAIRAGEVSPVLAGDLYCNMIEACHEIFDLGRAQEWTEALGQWCAGQEDLVAHRGQCMLRRAEILEFHGAWEESREEAERARERLAEPGLRPGAGGALYQLAELHRLRGAYANAETFYRRASEEGRRPQPGLALLRLAQGQLDAATAAIRLILDQGPEGPQRARILAACVDILLPGGDLPAARSAAEQLAELANHHGAPLLRAMSAQASGAVLLAERDAGAALGLLRQAWAIWRDLAAPYEAARVEVLIGMVCRELGDTDTAELEFDAARRAFTELGAAPDLARVEALLGKAPPQAVGKLTTREVEVLGLVASGRTNRAISEALGISDKTVARHLSNIFTKLGLTSRSAATAYAYQHDLV